ncbi:MAG: hypothetical protein CMO55_23165 [Verrucomicrobiales bacterium]|nr:hypothetical protein [Verrucomicrobiales bacterium]
MSLIPITPVQLKEFRQRIGITQSGLAHELGVSLPTIQRWESGRTKMPVPLGPALNELEASRAVASFVKHINGCRREKGLFSTRIEITRLVFARLAAWDGAEWEARFPSVLTSAKADDLAEKFADEGLSALNEFSLALGLTIELLSEDPTKPPMINVKKSLPRIESPSRKDKRSGRLLSFLARRRARAPRTPHALNCENQWGLERSTSPRSDHSTSKIRRLLEAR